MEAWWRLCSQSEEDGFLEHRCILRVTASGKCGAKKKTLEPKRRTPVEINTALVGWRVALTAVHDGKFGNGRRCASLRNCMVHARCAATCKPMARDGRSERMMCRRSIPGSTQ